MTGSDPSDGASFDETVDAMAEPHEAGPVTGVSRGTRPSPPTSHLDLERGASLGRYIVIERLGAGGMGVVYKAYDPQLDRSVAVKLVLTQDLGTSGSTGAARLLREAQAMARLSHPNVVPVFDVGLLGTSEEPGEVYVAMEFIAGRTLKEAGEGAPATEVMGWYTAAGRGLAAAHAAGLVHRDFKPDNAIVGDDGRVRVLDFGLARAGGPGSTKAGEDLDDTVTSQGEAAVLRGGSLDSALTVAGAVIGTPAYMSPEQHAGIEAGPPSDQFSFAVSLYEALAGHRPFEGDSLAALAFSVMKGKPRAIDPARSVPAHVERALRRALCPDPADRFASVDALLTELERDPAARRRRWAWAAAGTVAVAGLGGLGGLGLGRGSDETMMVAVDPCAEAGAAANVVLGGDRERAALDALPERTRPGVERALRRFESDWRASRVEACTATRVRGEQSEALMDSRMACLDHRLDDVASLLDLAAADTTVHDKALSAFETLADPARLIACADVDSLRDREPAPVDPRLVERIAAAEHTLSELRALGHTGKVGDALKGAAPLVEEVRAIGWAPLEAEVTVEQGALHSMKGDGPAAEEALTEAFRAALAGRDDATAIDAASRLVYVIGHTRAEADRGLEWAEHARALLRRHPIPNEAASLEQSIAAVLVTAGRYDDGIEAHRRAIAAFEELQGPRGVDVAIGMNNMGGAYFAKGDAESALPLHEQALAIFEEVRTEGHPDLATTLSFLGNARGGLGEFAAAQRDFERAHAMAVAAFGETNRTSAIALDNAARMVRKQGQVDEAIAIHERALKIWIELLGEDHADVGISRLNVGYAWVAAKDHEKALAAFTAALASFEKSVGGEHPFIMYACNSVGTSLVELGRPREAYACLERVLGMDDSQVDSTLTAETRFVLARARWDAGEDRRGALKLAREAAAQYRGGGAEKWKESIDQIDAWVRARG